MGPFVMPSKVKSSRKTFLTIDLMHNDVTRPEKQYGSCSDPQIQDGGQ